MWFLFSWGLKANSRQAGYQSGFGSFSCLRIACFHATRTTERKFTNWGRRWLRSWGTWQCDDKHREMLSFSNHFYTHMYFIEIYYIISYYTISCYILLYCIISYCIIILYDITNYIYHILYIYILYISFNAFDPRFIRQVLQHTRERVEGGVGRFLRHKFVIFYDDYQSQSGQGHALFWQVLETSKHIKAYQSTHSNHHGATYDMGWHQMIWQHLQSAADCMFGGLRCFDFCDISSLLWLCIFVMICMSPRGQRDGIEMLHGVVFKDEGRAPCSRSPVARREETSDRGGPSVHWHVDTPRHVLRALHVSNGQR